MRVAGSSRRTIWELSRGVVEILDQTRLPHAVETLRLTDVEGAIAAIADMRVRGAPLIGVAAAYGLALALRADPSDVGLDRAVSRLAAARPTAVNLRWALDRVRRVVAAAPNGERFPLAWRLAGEMAEEDVAACRAIGEHGAALIGHAAEDRNGPVHILTHCNAGWLAAVDWGTALAPVYAAHARGVPVHVWVDETRPRNQGAALTAFELGHEGVPHTVIADNAGGHLMQQGRVDLCLVGADRITRRGDAAYKIGTYLKALAAYDNGVPFHVAAPVSTVDWTLDDGVREIPIEERSADEVLFAEGALEGGERGRVRIAAPGSAGANFGFDVTPARLVTAIVTERGVSAPENLADLFPEAARDH